LEIIELNSYILSQLDLESSMQRDDINLTSAITTAVTLDSEITQSLSLESNIQLEEI